MNGGCPHCRQMNFKRMTNKALIREINEFRVYCTHRKEGCGWVGKLAAIENHLESDRGCDYVEVRCTNYGFSGRYQVDCGVPMKRMYLTNHQQNECEYRRYTCEHCGYIDTYDAIAGTGYVWSDKYYKHSGKLNHYNDCDHYPLECPNKCGEKAIKRMDMEAHQEICPMEPLDCPFESVGCKNVIRRKDLATHTQTNMEAHLLLLVESHQELVCKSGELVCKNDELFCKNDELVHKSDELVRKNDELVRKNDELVHKNDELVRKSNELTEKMEKSAHDLCARLDKLENK